MKIIDVITGASSILFQRKKDIFRAIVIPTLGIIFVSILVSPGLDDSSELLFAEELESALENPEWISSLFISWILTTVLAIVSVAFYIYIAVIVHRHVLLGEGSTPKWGISKWSSRETTFLVTTILLYLMIFIPAMIFEVLVESLGKLEISDYITLIPCYYFIARFSLVFPSIALGKDMTFKESWRLTKNKQLLIITVVGIVPSLLSIPITDYIPEHPLTAALVSLYSCLILVFGIALLSRAYHACIERKK